MSEAAQGRLFILSAPSGAGKTTLRKAICQRLPQLAYSVSHTTRAPRQGEEEGRDYFFITQEEFVQGIGEGRWAEWAEVYGNYYGTSARFIDRCLAQGCRVVLDIDVQGTEKILKKFPSAVTIFIMPPSMEALARRLSSRNTDNEEVINKRMAVAAWEMDKGRAYAHAIVNDDLESAIRDLEAVIMGYGVPPPCPEAEARP